MKNILVTGATGLVGSNLCQYLVDKGFTVKALIRETSDKRFLDSLKKVEYVYCDLKNKDKLIEELKDIDTVFHCAAQVNLLSTYDNNHASTNIQGTRNLLEASLVNKVKKFVYVSTLGVLGILRDHYSEKEDAPYIKSGNPYFDTKIDAERIVQNYYHDKNLPTVIIRPGFIIGERDRNNLPLVMPYLLRNQMQYIGHGNNDIAITSIRNLSQALYLAATTDKSDGQIYNITDGTGISSKQYINELCKIANIPLPKFHIPINLASNLAKGIESVSKVLDRESLINEYTISLIGNSNNFDISKAVNELDYKPNENYEEELKKAVDWYLQNHPKEVKRARAYVRAKRIGAVSAILTVAGWMYFSKKKKNEITV
ncbi:MAG: NAD-dependent epimerase/dehydratase family protein [Candidatus Sericytochromatia bacterium]